jgi:4-hydroxybenzoate polyprenyltransferase
MLKQIIKLIRVKQWYKNLLVFVPLFFAGNLFTTNIAPYILGFIALSFISSSYYIINDLKDIKEDRAHREKKKRPLASKKITKSAAYIIMIILLSIAAIISINIGYGFAILVGTLFVATNTYIFYLKKIAFLDIIMISINFLIRTIAGAYILSNTITPTIEISPWLILCVFFLAIFLTASKREADMKFLKENAKKHKETLEKYDIETTNFITSMSITMLITVYSLYIILVKTPLFLITLPITLYAIMRYYYLLKTKNQITRHPENFYKDKGLLISITLWIITTATLIYI